MSDETANPETGAGAADVAVDPMQYLLNPVAEAPQEEQTTEAPEAEEVEPEVATADAEGDEAPEADAADDEPEEAAEEPRYTVKIDGEEVEVTLSELRNGYQKDADYRRKTATISEERRALEAQKAAIEQEKAQIEQFRLHAMAEAGIEPEPDWEKLTAEDPIGAFEKRVQWEAAQKRRTQAQQHLQARQQAEREAMAKREWEALAAKQPEWKDPEKAKAASARMTAAAQSYGFTPEEVGQVLDHRIYLLLSDAAAYRELKSAKPVVEKKVAQAPKAMAPGSSPAKADVKAQKARSITETLKRNPNDKDAALAYLLGA